MKKYIKDTRWAASRLSFDVPNDDGATFVLDVLDEWYQNKHRQASSNEIKFLNTKTPKSCPNENCNSLIFFKNGKSKKGLQRYECKECGKRFTILTNTIFDNHKIPISEWIEFLMHLFEYHSVRSSSRDNRNAESTGRYWIPKIFEVLNHYQDNIVLSGIIYLDETFFSFKKDEERKNPSYKRPATCVGTIFDGKRVFLYDEGVKKENSESTYITFKDHIKEGSTIIRDNNHSHKVLIEKLNLKEIIISREQQSKLDDSTNPLTPINNLHSLLKRFMNCHIDFSTYDLQNWLNLFSFIQNPPDNRYEKIKVFIEMALNHRVTMRYRDVMHVCTK